MKHQHSNLNILGIEAREHPYTLAGIVDAPYRYSTVLCISFVPDMIGSRPFNYGIERKDH